MTRHCWRTRWEHSKSAILLDDDARRSEVALRVWRPAASLQAAQLAPKIYYNRPRSGPTEIGSDRDRVRPKVNDNMANGLFYSNATFETLFSLFGGQFTDEVTFIKLFFPIMSWFIRLLIGRELSFATA